MRFAVVSSTEAEYVRVELRGEADLTVRDKLADVLGEALALGSRVVIDLADLEFIDSSVVHVLVKAHQDAQASDRSLFVVNAVGLVAHVLELTEVDTLLPAPGDWFGQVSGSPDV